MTTPQHPPAHAHTHGGAGPAHAHSHAPNSASLAGDPRARRALRIALALGLVVLVIELVAGVAFHSLALLGDAAHIVTDVGAYGIALWAASAASRPPTATRTFGTGRVEILAALANGATLLAASGWIAVEAAHRLVDPAPVDGAGLSAVAALGLASNAIALTVLWRAGSSSLNMRGAMLHAAGDLLGSLAAVIAGVLVATTGWERADPIASLLLVTLIVAGAWRLVRASADVLLDAAPAGMDAERVGSALLAVERVLEVHDVHVWTIAPGAVAASAHVRIASGVDASATLDSLQQALRVGLGIRHSTIQLRVDRGSVPVEATPLMGVDDAVAWATDHIARSHPGLTRGVIAAAAGAAALGLDAGGRVSPVAITKRTLGMLRGSAHRLEDGDLPGDVQVDPPD